MKDNRIEGYVKPLFANLDVYDPAQDRDKSLGRKIYEKVVEGASKLLKNAPRKEVATVATISGPVEEVKTHTWRSSSSCFRTRSSRRFSPASTSRCA